MNGPRYTLQMALELIALCEASYRVAHGETAALAPEYSAPVIFRLPPEHRPFLLVADDLDIWGFAVERDGIIYLIFRGTQDAQEWALDAYAFPMADFCEGRAHCGIAALYEALKPAIFAALPADWHERPLVVAGHSLGAALATLFVVEFPPELSVTFAGPRVVDPENAARLWQQTHVRVMDEQDWVPKIPLDPPFRHGGREVLIDGPGCLAAEKAVHQLANYRIGLLKMPESSP